MSRRCPYSIRDHAESLRAQWIEGAGERIHYVVEMSEGATRLILACGLWTRTWYARRVHMPDPVN